MDQLVLAEALGWEVGFRRGRFRNRFSSLPTADKSSYPTQQIAELMRACATPIDVTLSVLSDLERTSRHSDGFATLASRRHSERDQLARSRAARLGSENPAKLCGLLWGI